MSGRIRALLVAVAVVVAGAGGAAAYWSGGGQGNLEVYVPRAEPLEITAGSPAPHLYPGGTADVAVMAANSNAESSHVVSLELDTGAGHGGFDVDAAHAGCDVSTLSFVPQDNLGAGWTVPPRTGATDGSLQIELQEALAMGIGAANACQGATFTVHLKGGN